MLNLLRGDERFALAECCSPFAVKIPGRPDVTELTKGQNQVRLYAEKYLDNTTPTWAKAPEDKMTNWFAAGLTAFGACMMLRSCYDMAYDVNKIPGR